MTHEQLREEWKRDYPWIAVISHKESDAVLRYWLSRLDAYADAKVSEYKGSVKKQEASEGSIAKKILGEEYTEIAIDQEGPLDTFNWN